MTRNVYYSIFRSVVFLGGLGTAAFLWWARDSYVDAGLILALLAVCELQDIRLAVERMARDTD